MQIPPIDRFRQEEGVSYDLPWSVDPEGADFTLTLPSADDGWAPHEPSYRMATDVLAALDDLTAKGVEFLAETVNPAKLGAVGEPYLVQVRCDARTGTVMLEMSWDTNVYAAWSVTYVWREGPSRWPWPVGMGLRPR